MRALKVKPDPIEEIQKAAQKSLTRSIPAVFTSRTTILERKNECILQKVTEQIVTSYMQQNHPGKTVKQLDPSEKITLAATVAVNRMILKEAMPQQSDTYIKQLCQQLVSNPKASVIMANQQQKQQPRSQLQSASQLDPNSPAGVLWQLQNNPNSIASMAQNNAIASLQQADEIYEEEVQLQNQQVQQEEQREEEQFEEQQQKLEEDVEEELSEKNKEADSFSLNSEEDSKDILPVIDKLESGHFDKALDLAEKGSELGETLANIPGLKPS